MKWNCEYGKKNSDAHDPVIIQVNACSAGNVRDFWEYNIVNRMD